MSHHMWMGPGKMEEIELVRANVPTISEPSSPDMPGVEDEKIQLFECTVPNCGKHFKHRGILARHFNSGHSDIFEDKDSWRAFSSEIWI